MTDEALDVGRAGAPSPVSHRAVPASARSGAVLSIVGPDGAGKTTLIDSLLQGELAGAPVLRMRRPGVLYRRSVPDVPVTEPHRDPPYHPLASLAKTAYLLVDVWLGWRLRIRPFVRRGGWVIIERGWWDIAVDPLRYRMRQHGRLLWWLGRLLPAPDLLMILEAPPEVVFARKTELTVAELGRQMGAWRDHLPARQKHVFLDASRPASEVTRRAAEAIARLGEHSGALSLGPGWTAVPRRAQPRWVLPRGPRSVARSGLLVYQPINLRARIGWELARAAALVGAFRVLPRGGSPPAPVRDALTPYVSGRSTLSVARTNYPGRYVALVLGTGGECQAVAKVATDARGRVALATEARALADLGHLLQAPVVAPRILAHDDALLLFEMTKWRARNRPWLLPRDVAFAMGRFYRSGSDGNGTGIAHGDFAPWNLLRTRAGWVLLDWEDARRDAPPFYDLWHFLVQGLALLGRPRDTEIFAGLGGGGWIADVIRAYSDGAGIPAADAVAWFPSYLELSKERLDAEREDGRIGLAARAALLAKLRP
jgi:thymidylate kinase